ncbi:MAG: thioesterase family protein [Ilumatobacteraceae bacterium]
MTRTAVVVGIGERASGWATRFLAAGFDVTVDDRTVADRVAAMWPAAERLGLFPGATPDRLAVGITAESITDADIVQVVGNAPTPAGARLVATDITAHAHEPIHLLPLVELAGSADDEALEVLYRSIGMVPCMPDVPAAERRPLAEAIVELAGDDPDAIIAVMRALRPSGRGAGAALAHHEAVRLAGGAPQRWTPGDDVPAPLTLYRAQVEPDWVDYNGHMTEAAYLTAAGWASDALFRYIGDDEEYREAGHSFYTVETHIVYLLEMDLHEPLAIDTQLLGVDAKRVHLVHVLRHGVTAAVVATCEQMLVHVETSAGRSAPILPDVAAALAAIADPHASLPVPAQVGAVMRMPPARNAATAPH